jgi:hypothetical protein
MVTQSVFKQDQIVRDKYARHLDDKRQEEVTGETVKARLATSKVIL